VGVRATAVLTADFASDSLNAKVVEDSDAAEAVFLRARGAALLFFFLLIGGGGGSVELPGWAAVRAAVGIRRT